MTNKELTEAQQNIQCIRDTVYEYKRDGEFPSCGKHHLPQVLTCAGGDCGRCFQALCVECAANDHSGHPVVEIRDVVPRLQQQLSSQWENIERQNTEIRNGYRKLDDNLQYCIDLFRELKGQGDVVVGRGLSDWCQIITCVKNWMTEERSKDWLPKFLYELERFSKQQHMGLGDLKNLQFAAAESKRLKAVDKEQRRIAKIRKFVDSALVFSQELDSDLNELQKKLKIKPPPKLQFNIAKITSLDVQAQPPLEELEKVDELVLALKEDAKSQADQLGKLISNYSKLKCLEIKGDKFKVKDKTWEAIIDAFPSLLKLREMKLSLRGEDVPDVARLFEKHLTKLRPIDKLHLKITDCKQLEVYYVYTLCNCFELSGLWLTVTRCNLSQQPIKDLLIGLRTSTRMTNLPMAQLYVNLCMNRLDKRGEVETSKLFQQRCRGIAKRSLQL